MNRADLHEPGNWCTRPLPVAVSFNTDPAEQLAAAQRLARSAQRGELHMSVRSPDEAFYAARARALAQCAHNPSRVLPQPKVSRGFRETGKAATETRTPPVVRVPIAAPPRTKLGVQDVLTCLQACADEDGMSFKQITRSLNAVSTAVGQPLNKLVQQCRVWYTGERRERRYRAAR